MELSPFGAWYFLIFMVYTIFAVPALVVFQGTKKYGILVMLLLIIAYVTTNYCMRVGWLY